MEREGGAAEAHLRGGGQRGRRSSQIAQEDMGDSMAQIMNSPYAQVECEMLDKHLVSDVLNGSPDAGLTCKPLKRLGVRVPGSCVDSQLRRRLLEMRSTSPASQN